MAFLYQAMTTTILLIFYENAHEYSSSFSKSTPRLYSSISSSIKDLIKLNTCTFNLLYLMFKKSYKQYLLRGIV